MKCKNSYLVLNASVVMLTIRKKNGEKKRFFIDSWNWPEVSEYIWYCTSRGYAKTSNKGKTLSLAEVVQYPRFKSERAVWHHVSALKDDNRTRNLAHVPWKYNVLMNFGRKPGKSGINGVFLTPSGKYRVRDVDSRKFLGTFKNKSDAILARYAVLRKKGLDDEDAKRLMGMVPRRQYDEEYCQRLLYGE